MYIFLLRYYGKPLHCKIKSQKIGCQFPNDADKSPPGTHLETKLSRPVFACFSQGTKWYRTTIGKNAGAWGFADGASRISLHSGDWLDSNGDKRLSLYVNHVHDWGGYRCGTTLDLDLLQKSPDWEKVFYHAD